MNKLNHIAFILDGNGRWAKQRNKPRIFGHTKGAEKIKDVILWCIEKDIKTISMYLFSLENHKRPEEEKTHLFKILWDKLTSKKTLDFFNEHSIRLIWNGLETQISDKIVKKIKEVCELTKNNKYNLNILFNYGSQQIICDRINKYLSETHATHIELETMDKLIDKDQLGPVDLLIRTANEHRLSNFLLWEVAYAELLFSKLTWPEYSKEEFLNNLEDYYSRTRKFGGLK